ncbi:cuticle protein 8-like [Anabrus simplex]|uniref:cuticle protein 8-like n=1 Tax=Anabrus simplex TaxID=316456 RepID=UPI0035A3946B
MGAMAQYGQGGGYGGGHGYAQSIAHFSGPVVGHAQPIVAHGKYGKEIIDYVAYPKYKFLYDIADHHTGDFHGQEEVRDGHNVHGIYRLKEPSGGERSVKYVSTPKEGFLAEVHTGKIIHPTGHKYGGYESQKY